MTKQSNFRRFLRWTRQTLDMLCDRPDHLQRLSIVGAGMSLYPAVFAMIGLLVWFAVTFGDTRPQVVSGLIVVVYILLALFALVIVSLLGTIKGLRIGPKGLELTTIADDPDVDPRTTRDTRLAPEREHTGWGGYGGDSPEQQSAGEAGKSDMQVTP